MEKKNKKSKCRFCIPCVQYRGCVGNNRDTSSRSDLTQQYFNFRHNFFTSYQHPNIKTSL